MRKIALLLCILSLTVACAWAEDAPRTVTITALDGKRAETKIDVPYNPQRIAILDLAALDILDNLGLGERVVGCASTGIGYLAKYTGGNIENLGTIKDANFEAVMACEPDIIFIGGRLANSYEALSRIAPVIHLTTDIKAGLVESVRKNSMTIASIFGLEAQVGSKMAGFNDRIAILRKAADGHKAVIGMCTSGSFNLLGNTGRLSLIVNEIGFENVGANLAAAEGRRGRQGRGQAANLRNAAQTDTGGTSAPPHGEEASFELVYSLNPEYIFVLDRDSAISTKGAKLAADIMSNELINKTDAYRDGHLIILKNPAVWYTAEGGITALDYMLSDLEDALLK